MFAAICLGTDFQQGHTLEGGETFPSPLQGTRLLSYTFLGAARIARGTAVPAPGYFLSEDFLPNPEEPRRNQNRPDVVDSLSRLESPLKGSVSFIAQGMLQNHRPGACAGLRYPLHAYFGLGTNRMIRSVARSIGLRE
jgi:hypothetical protein